MVVVVVAVVVVVKAIAASISDKDVERFDQPSQQLLSFL